MFGQEPAAPHPHTLDTCRSGAVRSLSRPSNPVHQFSRASRPALRAVYGPCPCPPLPQGLPSAIHRRSGPGYRHGPDGPLPAPGLNAINGASRPLTSGRVTVPESHPPSESLVPGHFVASHSPPQGSPDPRHPRKAVWGLQKGSPRHPRIQGHSRILGVPRKSARLGRARSTVNCVGRTLGVRTGCATDHR